MTVGAGVDRDRHAERTRPARVAYFLWSYPVLTQTFVQREVAALAEAGFPVDVIAEGPASLDAADDDMRALCRDTIYLAPFSAGSVARRLALLLATRPRRALAALAYVRTHRHSAHKTLRRDLDVFLKAAALAEVIRDRQIEHIHAGWADHTAFIALLAADLVGITYSVQARASADLYRRGSAHALREKFARARFVITNSDYNVDYIRTFLDRSQWGKVHRIYNGLRLEAFEPREPPRPDARDSRPLRLLSVGRLIEEKGFVHLLRACQLLRQRGVRFRCEIVGRANPRHRGRHERELRRLHADLDLGECVDFLGARPFSAVLEHYRSADIFVLPCVVAAGGGRDVTPNALIEAMAVALPVVATDSAALPEIVEDGVSGLLVSPGDPEALAGAIARLAADPEWAARLGRAARARVEERFDIRKNVRARVALFSSAGSALGGQP